jgi:hypothetical protein
MRLVMGHTVIRHWPGDLSEAVAASQPRELVVAGGRIR